LAILFDKGVDISKESPVARRSTGHSKSTAGLETLKRIHNRSTFLSPFASIDLAYARDHRWILKSQRAFSQLHCC